MTALFLEAAVKATLIVAVAAMAIAMRRRGAAASRHLIGVAAVVALLALPLLLVAVPAWNVPVVPAEAASRVAPAYSTATSAGLQSDLPVAAVPTPVVPAFRPASSAGVQPALLLPALYVSGVFLLLARLAVLILAVRGVRRRAADIDEPAWLQLRDDCARQLGLTTRVRLLRSLAHTMPMAAGVRRPAILLPAIADTWDEDRRRAVLLHELAHIARHDCLTQIVASIACAVYWMHPGVWWLAARLRREREFACDDRVLAAGACPDDYAGHLLELAYAASGMRAPALALGMARPRTLEGRLRAVLDPDRSRAAASRRARVAGLALASTLVLAVAAVTLTADRAQSQAGDAAEATPADARAFDQNEAARWTVRPGRTPDQLHITVDGFHGRATHTVRIDQLPAALEHQVRAAGPVHFAVDREAGTFTISGQVQSGAGSGTVAFRPGAAFAATLTERGYAGVTAATQALLALHDVGVAFLDTLQANGVRRPTIPEVIRAVEHGVREDYVRGMSAAGIRVDVLEDLIRLRDHGVSPEFINALAAQVLTNLDADDLIRARDHGVSAEYIASMRALGHELDVDAAIRARDHGIGPEYLQSMALLGYEQLSLDELVRARDHGVSAEYVSAMRALGYRLDLDGVVRARDHGVSPEFVRDVAALGYDRLELDTLVRLRDHGVSPEYIRQLQAFGFRDLSTDDLIRMRDEGVGDNDVHVRERDLIAFVENALDYWFDWSIVEDTVRRLF